MYEWSKRSSGLEDPVVKNLLKILQRQDIITFSAGSPAPNSFPVAGLQKAFDQVFNEQGATALQYGISEGYAPLRQWIADRASRLGINCGVDNVLITNGSQQVIDLVAKVLLDPGDLVMLEQPTYLAALQVFRGYQANFVAIAMDDNGLDLKQVELELKRSRPKFIYVIPTFQNPTGITLSLERRQRLAELANYYEVLLLEDNPYGELRYEGDEMPAIKGMADSKWLMYAGTASKIIAPGLRLGWLIAHPDVIAKVAAAKQASDVLSNSLTQRAVYTYVSNNDLDANIGLILEQYRLQRDVMLAAMKQHFPSEIQWQVPQGGMFVWVTLPPQLDAALLLPRAIAEAGVAYVPGTAFFADQSGANTLRLNFSQPTPAIIEEGIAKLGKFFTMVLNEY